MASVAEQLRQAREARKLDVYQVAETTKIRTDHIRALEAGDYDGFAAPVYIRGFVRTYATLLKLDLARVMSDLDAELSQTEKFAESTNAKPGLGIIDWFMLQLSRLNWGIVAGVVGLALVAAAVVFGVRAWDAHRKRDPLRALRSGMYTPKENFQHQYLPLPTNGAPRR